MNANGHYVVQHGKSAGVGCFASKQESHFHRGDRVVVETARGLEAGDVLCPATPGKLRLLGPQLAGYLVRAFSNDDRIRVESYRQIESSFFDHVQEAIRTREWAAQVLDVDWLLDGQALVQFLAHAEFDWEPIAAELGAAFGVQVRFENLALPAVPEEHGCGKPDCGKGEGGCSTCSTGGCGTGCGTAGADLRPYFAHLREKMDERVSLL